jgi:hypothetical protein
VNRAPTLFFSLLGCLIASTSWPGENGLIRTDSDFEGLPNPIRFDCPTNSDEPSLFVRPFDSRMRVPTNFVPSDEDSNWLNWNVIIVGPAGDSRVFPFASIHIGNVAPAGSFTDEFTTVSNPATNGINARVLVREPQAEDFKNSYSLLLIKNSRFLKVVAFAPVDWVSLIGCFE